MTNSLLFYGVLLVSLVVHEAAHALFALLGGDRTAYTGGQVTLNPVPHIRREPFGTVILPLMLLLLSGGKFCLGYATTPIDPIWAYRHPKRAALMSAAGPLSNMLLAAIAYGVLYYLLASDTAMMRDAYHPMDLLRPADGATEGALFALIQIAVVFLFMNLMLVVLNLIPLPPLDGSGVLGGLFPKSLGKMYDYLRTQPQIMLMGMIGIFYGFQYLFWPIMVRVFNSLPR